MFDFNSPLTTHNVLFEGGAGETIRRKLLENTDLHTILRLPTGVFYAQGIKANVIFFDNREASPDPWTKEVWYYDYRTNIHHTLKKKPMRYEHLSDFIECYNSRNRHRRKATWNEQDAPEGRWRSFSYEELTARDKTSLDVFWLKDKSLVDRGQPAGTGRARRADNQESRGWACELSPSACVSTIIQPQRLQLGIGAH